MVFLVIAGAVFLIAAAAGFLYERIIIANGVEADATVVRVEEEPLFGKKNGGNKDRNADRWKAPHIYYAILLYTADNGRDYEAIDYFGFSIRPRNEGDVFKVCYHRESPAKAVVKGKSLIISNILYLIFAALGIIAVETGIRM
jgi:hypothetical protein